MTAPVISAVMVSWQTGPALFDSIHAVRADPDISELILVDHQNPDDVRQRLDALTADHARLRVIRTDQNLGFGKGCNIGAKEASGDYLFFINPDARPEAGAARQLIEALPEGETTALAGARILGLDGKEQSGSRRRGLTLGRALATFSGISKTGWVRPFGMEGEPLPEAPVNVGAISGAAFLMSKSGFDALGGFDEGYFLHVEDVDLCRRASSVWFVPDAIVHHVGGSSRTSRFAVELEKAKSFLRYFWKFNTGTAGRLATLIAAPFIFTAIMLRALIMEVIGLIRR
ncbi:glycosyltransferase family 2 protein [Hyphobacterium sp. CCMP332]|uniref:glycosyltransferase family 2 protein n=1 Tax=Hyphobacterium sp. CCMP332 TaxID=2749086 RepID=UPI0016508B40|nr:glycosyltransferase family 2 protein [Hyphobacterium sp. CCMP332]QNL17983.1 glycosyltransferase family 2 protein [Hyphobacterium sp. CCMP332]